MTSRILFAALTCLTLGGCAIGDNIIGPPFVWVEDTATRQSDTRTDGYPGEPKEIAVFPPGNFI